MKKTLRNYTYMAHLVRADGSSAGGIDIVARDREKALEIANRFARVRGLKCADVTGPAESEE